MENQGILLYIGIALIILLVLWYIWTANNLIAKRNRVKQCRSGICVALKQCTQQIITSEQRHQYTRADYQQR